jgi:hypothetical protein
MPNDVYLNWTRPVSETCTVADFIEACCAQACAPQLAWAEPDVGYQHGGKATRITNFDALVGGKPKWRGLPLAEARLFFAKKAIHIVSDPAQGGCRWVSLAEETSGAEKDKVYKEIKPVLALRDLQRFGFTQGYGIDKLFAIEYRRHGRLMGWRLVRGNVQ